MNDINESKIVDVLKEALPGYQLRRHRTVRATTSGVCSLTVTVKSHQTENDWVFWGKFKFYSTYHNGIQFEAEHYLRKNPESSRALEWIQRHRLNCFRALEQLILADL
jgi:hypothetical protein